MYIDIYFEFHLKYPFSKRPVSSLKIVIIVTFLYNEVSIYL